MSPSGSPAESCHSSSNVDEYEASATATATSPFSSCELLLAQTRPVDAGLLYHLVPELEDATDFVNDVLSFYREIQDGEPAIPIPAHLQVGKMSPEEALRAETEHLVELKNRVMGIVDRSSSLECKNRLMLFFKGYIKWHLDSSRFRLKKAFGQQGAAPEWLSHLEVE